MNAKKYSKKIVSMIDKEMIKKNNKKMIINLIRKKGELTQSDIKEGLSISITTIINNINELLDEGIVELAGTGDSTGGRKPVIVRFCKNAYYSFGVEFLPGRIRIILVNLDSEVLRDITIQTPVENTPEKIFFVLCENIEKIIVEQNISKKRVLGIGISIPATVNEEKLLLEEAVSLGFRNVDFGEFEKMIVLPVYIENEANIAAYAEMKLGIAKEISNVVYVSITKKGVGTGIVIQGHLYKGKNKRAGECGHIKIIMEGERCVCGRLGCWNAYVSEDSLISQYNRVSKEEVYKLEEFISLLESGEETAKVIWERYLDYFATGLDSIINTFDPNYVIIGGKIAQYEQYLLEPLKDRIFKDNIFFKRDDVKILISKLKGDSSILGASLLALEKFYNINDKIICL